MGFPELSFHLVSLAQIYIDALITDDISVKIVPGITCQHDRYRRPVFGFELHLKISHATVILYQFLKPQPILRKKIQYFNNINTEEVFLFRVPEDIEN